MLWNNNNKNAHKKSQFKSLHKHNYQFKKNKRKMTAPFHGSPARENMESPVKELGVKLPGIQHIKFMHRSECLAPKLANVYIYSQRNSEVV